MTITRLNGHNGLKGNVNGNGVTDYSDVLSRPRPQESYYLTSIHTDSFYGKLRRLYANKVLKTQLEQLKKQGSYDAFKLKWHPVYETRRLHGAKARVDATPPSLFWEIEGVCYFLSSPDAKAFSHAAEFDAACQELVDMIERAQQPDGYLNIYFTVVDPEGRFKNLRDMHEMYNAGHLLEAALAHHRYTGSRQFLDVMIKNIDCFINTFGPGKEQLHGYPGHPELELAVIRLYSLTKDPKHIEFAKYLLEARGEKRDDLDGDSYFVWEAQQRKDTTVAHTMHDVHDVSYCQAHTTLHEQQDILGHSVRAFYLLTAAADVGGKLLEDAKRLWTDGVDHKMYATGGFGTEPRIEGFSEIPYRLPQSTGEGGCYAETCASIAAMMTSERLLSHKLDGKVRDVMELCLLNAVLGGGSLDGTQFSYANKQATWGDEVATRKEWFEVCCCPPNLSRTLGMIGGYTWSTSVDEQQKTIYLDIYILLSATRVIPLPGGQNAKVVMDSEMPWAGWTKWTFEAPDGWAWKVRVPHPEYAANVKLSTNPDGEEAGFFFLSLGNSASLSQMFVLPVRLLASHPKTGQDTLTVSRGPIVYTAESVDNPSLDQAHPHFEGVGLASSATFAERTEVIQGIPVVMLQANEPALLLNEFNTAKTHRPVSSTQPARSWRSIGEGITFVPWFARANRGGAGHVRTAFLRADEALSL